MSRNDFVRLKDAATTREIDKSLKNKWSWNWLDEVVVVKDEKTKEVVSEEKISSWVEKVKKEGIAWCRLCDVEIDYKSAGKRCLIDHARKKKHLRAKKTVKENYGLPCKCEILQLCVWGGYSCLRLNCLEVFHYY